MEEHTTGAVLSGNSTSTGSFSLFFWFMVKFFHLCQPSWMCSFFPIPIFLGFMIFCKTKALIFSGVLPLFFFWVLALHNVYFFFVFLNLLHLVLHFHSCSCSCFFQIYVKKKNLCLNSVTNSVWEQFDLLEECWGVKGFVGHWISHICLFDYRTNFQIAYWIWTTGIDWVKNSLLS